MYLLAGNTEMNEILNLFFALVMVSAICARLFNELILFFYNVRIFTAFVHSISIIKNKGVQKRLPFVMFHVKHFTLLRLLEKLL